MSGSLGHLSSNISSKNSQKKLGIVTFGQENWACGPLAHCASVSDSAKAHEERHKADWALVCRYLMMRAVIENGCRTGEVQNMQLSEFQATSKLRGRWIVMVGKAKTVAYGATKIKIHDEQRELNTKGAPISWQVYHCKSFLAEEK